MNSAAAASHLDAALSLADPCRLCPRRCGARRLHGETGLCGAQRDARLFMEYLHYAEDALIAPAQTLHLDGCNLSCAFCQTREERLRLPAARLDAPLFRNIIETGFAAGAKSVDILGGEPGVNLPSLLEMFTKTGDFPSLVWNTNLYLEPEPFALLDNVADLILGDIKFGSPACAAALSGRADATDVAWERAKETYVRAPATLILRHLVLPGHFDCCTRPVLERIARDFPGVPLSLKTVFMPPVDMPPNLTENRFLTRPEVEQARTLARDLNLPVTEDAPLAPNAPRNNQKGGQVDFEIVITPEGGIYLRHATAEAVDMMLAATKGGNTRPQ